MIVNANGVTSLIPFSPSCVGMQGKKRTEKYHFLGGAASASFVASIGFAFYGHLVFAVPFMLVAVAAATIIDRYEFRDELENKESC